MILRPPFAERALAVKIAAVKALHVSDGNLDFPDCLGCWAECSNCEGTHPWPCPTIVALGGGVR